MKSFLIYVYHVKAYKGDLWLYSRNYCGPGSKLGEYRVTKCQERALPPEHPRASATDDVEGIIALKHEILGDIFDVKQFLDAQPKILRELTKRNDPDLEFFY